MSADLFAEFGEPQNSKATSQTLTNVNPSNLLIDTEDVTYTEDTWQSWPKTQESSIQSSARRPPETLWKPDEKGTDVLFDASDFDIQSPPQADEDDFGDFEQVNLDQEKDKPSYREPQILSVQDLDNPIPNRHELESLDERTSAASVSLVAVEDGTSRSDRLGTLTTKSADDFEDDWGDFETTGITDTHSTDHEETIRSANAKPSSVQLRGNVKPQPRQLRNEADPNKEEMTLKMEGEWDEEPWGDMDEDKPEIPTASKKPRGSSSSRRADIVAGAANMTQRERPTNMPPPAVLLGWIPKVFSNLAAQARQSGEDQTTGTGALQTYRMCARIIAGRGLRWKRDNILAQSVRIGAAGRSGGMKLVALDKGESRKEDQAAEEAIASWTKFSPTLNAAILKAKMKKPPMALSNKLTARPASGLDVVNSTLSCAACGLRRNERVVGIDVDVSDTFGEFWVEHWGHKDCADVWYQFVQLLDHR